MFKVQIKKHANLVINATARKASITPLPHLSRTYHLYWFFISFQCVTGLREHWPFQAWWWLGIDQMCLAPVRLRLCMHLDCWGSSQLDACNPLRLTLTHWILEPRKTLWLEGLLCCRQEHSHSCLGSSMLSHQPCVCEGKYKRSQQFVE